MTNRKISENEQIISQFITDVCRDLRITHPRVVEKDLLTDTMLAMISSDGSEIVVRTPIKITPDLFFSLAHELRHAWQIAHPEIHLMDGYKSRSESRDVVEYNLQPAEIDAHAYAAIVMRSTFGLEPLFHGLPDIVKTEILNRVKELKIESHTGGSND